MAVTHELIAVTGEYKTKDGQVKTRFQKVGVAMDNKKGGTSLLIIVVVAMDFMAQVQSFVMQQQYGSLMKKANFNMGA